MRKRWIAITVAVAIVVVAIAIGAGAHFFQPSSQNVAVPVKVSGPDGYIASTVKPATGSMETTNDTGEPGWVQVRSTGDAPAYTDLSRGGMDAIRMHNPRVLKTYSSLHSPILSMDSQVAKYSDAVVMNASGYDMGGTNVAYGIQINNGQLIRDWPSTGLHYTFVINKDGSTKIYSSATSAKQIIDAGAEQSYTFGTAIIWNGKAQNDGTVNWEGHSWIGTDADNNLYFLHTPTNEGYQRILDFFESLHLTNAVEMDSGGSCRLAYLGKVLNPGDGRLVPDYIIAKAG